MPPKDSTGDVYLPEEKLSVILVLLIELVKVSLLAVVVHLFRLKKLRKILFIIIVRFGGNKSNINTVKRAISPI